MNTTKTPPKSPPDVMRKGTPKKAAASGWIGSALEYYDWFVYAQAAALVFPTVFFPTDNATVALVASLGTYAVGYAARPVGAAVLGAWGDRRGRKNVLVFVMFLMGLSTVSIAFLPTFGQIGVLAPILLVLLRLIQGFAVAGELGGASAMIIEHSPLGRRGYYASFSLQGTQAGQIIAAMVFMPLAAFLPDDDFHSWGWRIPFLLSALVVFAGFQIRRRVDETPVFADQEAKKTTSQKKGSTPLREAVRGNGANILRATLMSLVNVVGVTVIVFGGAFATQTSYGNDVSTAVYLWIPIIANALAIALIPIFGDISDRIGRRPLMIAGPLAAGAFAWLYLYTIQIGLIPVAIVLAVLAFGVFYQVWNATFASFFQELFPARARVTGFAVSQNLGLALVAPMPAVFAAIAPPGTSNVPLIVGSITMALCIVGALAAWSAKETFRIPMGVLGEPDAIPVSEEEYAQARATHQ